MCPACKSPPQGPEAQSFSMFELATMVVHCCLQNACKYMLVRDPNLRPTAEQVLQHPWIKKGGTATDKPLEPEMLKRSACAVGTVWDLACLPACLSACLPVCLRLCALKLMGSFVLAVLHDSHPMLHYVSHF